MLGLHGKIPPLASSPFQLWHNAVHQQAEMGHYVFKLIPVSLRLERALEKEIKYHKTLN